MHKLLAIVLAAGLPAVHAASHLVDIQWDPQGVFRHRATVAPGKFVEVCGRLDAGSAVRWSFEAGAPVDFNIHYHVGKDVVYPVRTKGAGRGSARLAVKSTEDYCWMWSNPGTAGVAVGVELRR